VTKREIFAWFILLGSLLFFLLDPVKHTLADSQDRFSERLIEAIDRLTAAQKEANQAANRQASALDQIARKLK
jgi:hypothetical protein